LRGSDSGVVQIPEGLERWLAEVGDRLGPGGWRAELVDAAVRRTVTDAISLLPDGTAFVATGDIPAMWLRDSAAQVRPLLAAAHEPEVAELLSAVSRRQLEYVALDAYANAFNATPSGAGYHRDFADQSPWVWERKYEIDSLAWTFDFATRLFRATASTAHLDETWLRAVTAALDVMEIEQDHTKSGYTFGRPDVPAHDTLSHAGRGAPVGHTGMTWSGFRPSDDACEYGYLVPSNCFAAVALEGVAEIATDVFGNAALTNRVAQLAAEIRAGVAEYGVLQHASLGRVYAYEVDGLGNSAFQDDANVPSLLSLPYLGWCAADDPTYLATRSLVLSDANPRFYTGRTGVGVGSQHTRGGWVWPLAIAMRGLTSTDSAERVAALEMLEATTGGTDRMHESFDVNDPRRYTRGWFSWADMTYVDLALMTVGMSSMDV
jgi:meiotically up-regulated gene 157 (Mug157) protein